MSEEKKRKQETQRETERQTDIRKTFVIELSGVDNGEMRLESNGGNGWR